MKNKFLVLCFFSISLSACDRYTIHHSYGLRAAGSPETDVRQIGVAHKAEFSPLATLIGIPVGAVGISAAAGDVDAFFPGALWGAVVGFSIDLVRYVLFNDVGQNQVLAIYDCPSLLFAHGEPSRRIADLDKADVVRYLDKLHCKRIGTDPLAPSDLSLP